MHYTLYLHKYWMFKACKTPLYMWIRHKPLSLPRKFLGFAPLKCMPKWNGGFRLWRCVRACKTNKFGLIQLLRRTYEASYSEKTHVIVVVFRLSPCLECSLCSFGNFPGVWSIKADVSELNVCSIVLGQDDGTDIEFRNVGFYISDAGEIPKRT